MFLIGNKEIPGRRKAATQDQVRLFGLHYNREAQEEKIKTVLNVLWRLFATAKLCDLPTILPVSLLMQPTSNKTKAMNSYNEVEFFPHGNERRNYIEVFWFWLQPATKVPRSRPSPRWGAEDNGNKQAETGGSG